MNFDLGVPITWADIINTVSTLCSLSAVIVALFANFSASKALNCSLKMQEQSKNIELFDQRIGVIDSLRQDNMPSETRITLLFNYDENIYMLYRLLKEQKRLYENACDDEKVFFQALDGTKEFRDPNNDVKSTIEEYEFFLEHKNCTSEIVEKYKSYCEQHEQWWSPTGLSDDRRIYNHAVIRERKLLAKREIEKSKCTLIQEMEKYVANSIAPISKT